MINLTKAHRATVDEKFIAASKELFKTKLWYIHEKASQHQNPTNFYSEYRGTISSMLDLLKRPTSMDTMVTRLRCLDFVSFSAETYNNVLGLQAITKPVTIGDFEGPRSYDYRLTLKDYKLGQYLVFIPLDNFIKMTSRDIQLVPLKAPKVIRRHPHHLARPPYDEHFESLPEDKYEWWDMKPDTCWGGFNNAINSALETCDLPDMYRTIWYYLSRYDISSPKAILNSENFWWAV